MKTFSLDIFKGINDLPPTEKAYIEANGAAPILLSLLMQGLQSLYPNGLELNEGLILAGLQTTIQNFIKYEQKLGKYEDKMLLPDNQFELIRSVFSNEKVKFFPAQYRIISNIINNIKMVQSNE